jgi:putative thioredoxin
MINTVDSPYIHAANAENFKLMVLDNSKAGPVLVNFWSRKAGPCLRQYPVLDKIIHHYDGRLLLVNIDTENEFIITGEYGITSVPTLKLFRDGRVIKTWHGYQSEDDLRKLLDLYVTRDSDQVLANAIRHYAQGKQSEAYLMITNAIMEDAVNPRLPLALCKLLKHEKRYDEALTLINSLPAGLRGNPEIAQQKAILEFFAEADLTQDIGALVKRVANAPDDLRAKQQLAVHCIIQQQYEPALQQLADIMESDPAYNDN